VQAGPGLAGSALPTNQWWTSALTGPWTETLWARPLAARVLPEGVQVDLPRPVASGDAVVSGFAAHITLGGRLASMQVVDHGDFSVTMDAARADGGTLRVVVAQGLPAVLVRIPAGAEVPLTGRGLEDVREGGDAVRLRVAGRWWTVAAGGPVRWGRAPDGLRVRARIATWLAVAPDPDGAGAGWPARVAGLARAPVRTTRATMRVDHVRGEVRQRLEWVGLGGAGPVSLMPHHAPVAARALPGGFPSPLGRQRLVAAAAVTVRAPLPGLLPGVPDPLLGPGDAERLRTAVRMDAADLEVQGGSYWGPKRLWRLAAMSEVAARAGDGAARERLLDALEAGLDDWLGPAADRGGGWLSHDAVWGGLVGVPPEFGNQDFNDHHYHYGYLVAAAAVLAEARPATAARWGPLVDLMVGDVMGSAHPSLPAFRVWNAYEGHSFASGFAATPDGADQESSSEAVHAWWGIARWALATGRPRMAHDALARYAMEARTARMYWLGEGARRPAGYAHRVAGIVWGGKIDFATFFDPRPAAVVGIQLLPVSFASVYRHDRRAAAQRQRVAGADAADLWPDVHLTDLALARPAVAERRWTSALPVEPGGSRAMTLAWILTMRRLGPPQPAVRADAPYGAAFGPVGRPALAVVNPTPAPVTVTFRDPSGAVVGRVRAPAHAARTLRP